MGYVYLTSWKKYANKRDEDASGEALYQIYLDAAEDIVEEYLGYDPVEADYTQTIEGTGTDTLPLRAKPVTVLTSVTIDGESRDVADFTIDDNDIIDTTGNVFAEYSEIEIEYTAGWTTVPGIIQLTVMRIASLLSQEAGENIGVTSTSFDGGNSRTFINYTNFNKYLAALSKHRIVRL